MRPTLVVNPRTDPTFLAFVRQEIDGLPDDDPMSLQTRLRERHPAATVHVRLLSSEPSTVWYVYRDGRWMPSGTPAEESAGQAHHRTHVERNLTKTAGEG